MHFIPQLDRGGSERVLVELAFWQVKHNHNVLIVCFSPKQNYGEELNNLNVIYYPSPKFSYKLFGHPVHEMNDLEEKLKLFNADIFHSHSYWTDLILYSFPRLSKAYLTHFHLFTTQLGAKIGFDKAKFTSWIDKRLLLANYRKYHTNFICVSDTSLLYYKNILPKRLSSKIHLLRNPVNKKKFYPSSEKKENNNTLLTVGKLSEGKNHIFLLDVAKKLYEKNIDFKLLIVGDGPLNNYLESKIEEYGLKDVVKLKGIVENIEEIYRSSTLYLHSSRSESFGLVILEAMATGLPVIALKAKEENTLVNNNENGFIVDQESVENYSEKIEMLLNNKALYNKLSYNCINKAQNHDAESYGLQVTNIYRKLVN